MSYQPAAAAGGPVPNNLVLAILTTLFCCLPLGIAGIIFATQVNSKLAAGDTAGAMEASRKAKKFSMIGIIIGIVVYVIAIILSIVLGVLGGLSAR